MANEPIPPSTISIISGEEKNTLTWDYCPNEHFDDLENWTQVTNNGTISLIDGKIRLDVDDGYDGFASITDKYFLPQGNWNVNIDLVNYIADDPGTVNALSAYLRIDSLDSQNRIYVLYRHESNHESWITYRIDGSTTTGSPVDIGSTPSKLRISKIGTNLLVYVYTGSWVLIDQQDFGIYADTLLKIHLFCIDSNERGGYADFDNLIIVPLENCFPNEYFNNLDRWNLSLANGGTIVIDSGKALFDIPDSVNAGATSYYKYSILSGDFELSMDVSDYLPDDINNGVGLYPTVFSSIPSNYIRIRAYQAAVSNFNIALIYNINGGGQITKSATVLSSMPSKFKIERDSTTIRVHYYDGSWHEFDSQDFGAYASEINQLYVSLADRNLHGGSVKVDNLVLVDKGIESYNIYWANSPGVTVEAGTKITGVTSAYEHIDLNPNLTYYYILTAINSYDEGDPSFEFNSSPFPVAPTGINAISGFGANVISWNPSEGADFYNLYWKLTPGITKANGTKITGITFPHIHEELIIEQPYYYVVTAEDKDGESNISSETSSIPGTNAPENSIIITLESGDSENVITCDNLAGAVSYNLYWSNNSNLTIENGTKIEDIIRPYNHKKLTKGKYYYIITATNTQDESDASEIIEGKIYFEGKEFEHIAVMLRKILQQYKG